MYQLAMLKRAQYDFHDPSSPDTKDKDCLHHGFKTENFFILRCPTANKCVLNRLIYPNWFPSDPEKTSYASRHQKRMDILPLIPIMHFKHLGRVTPLNDWRVNMNPIPLHLHPK